MTTIDRSEVSQDTLKLADGIACALMRDEIEAGQALDARIEALELKIRAKLKQLQCAEILKEAK